MQKPSSYAAFEESIRRGWFNQQWNELVGSLQTLVVEGHLSPNEQEQLLELAKTLGIRDADTP